ncbi:MAG: flagellar motor protein [Ruminococcaceae bacterium]|nr:flagellar motor protein [Oscillospiraceae bacterium]
MAKIEKKPKENHDNDWLATYSDMVTLLLTFFVMLYASSSLDEQKWQYIYQAFQSRGKYLNEYVDQPEHTTDEGNYIKDEEPQGTEGSGELPQSFDQLYVYLSEYIEDEELSDAMSASKDSAHIYIRFNSGVFFEGNSSKLTTEGQQIINGICPALKAVKKSIQTVTVGGHTAVGISDVNDWDLSAGRASSVTKYLEFKAVLDSEQLRLKAAGPHEPVGDNNTEAGRAENRRVELVILKNDLDLTDEKVVQDILGHDFGLSADQVDPDKHGDDEGKLPNDSAQGVINNIESLFPSGGTVSTNDGVGPFVYDDFENFIKAEEPAASDADAAEGGEDSAASDAE